MTREPAKYIFHLKLGGGDRHKLAICAMAITAAKNGFRVLPTDGYGEMVPDLIIQREDVFHDGAHRIHKRLTYRVEVVDTHDPIPDSKPGGQFDDVVKVLLSKADVFCDTEHIGWPHPLCIQGLFWLCERSLP